MYISYFIFEQFPVLDFGLDHYIVSFKTRKMDLYNTAIFLVTARDAVTRHYGGSTVSLNLRPRLKYAV